MKPLIVFYDGPCVFCNYWVQMLCRWDKNDQLRFAPLEHPLFQKFVQERNLDLSQLDSIVVWDQTFSYAYEAEAVFMILKRLGGFWTAFQIFAFLPKSLTNGLYRWIAKNRYRWFGKHQNCPLPKPQYRKKFL